MGGYPRVQVAFGDRTHVEGYYWTATPIGVNPDPDPVILKSVIITEPDPGPTQYA